MKLYKFKIIGLIMTMLLYRTVIHSQITSFNSSQTNQIYITFLKDKIEAEAQTSVFNILTIKNYSDFKYEGKLNISLPRGWSLFGESTTEINIEPNDSLNIPVRVSIPGNVVSEVGYSVVATIVDMSGRNVKSAYSYVTIKRYTNFKVKQEKLFYYISNIEKKTDFAFNILNDGNVDELVHIEMLTSNNLSINNEFIEPVTKEYSLQPKKDSTLSFQVFYNEDDIDELFSQIKITTSTVDTSFNQTLWFKILTNYYALDIPEKSKCGILEFNIHNLFGTEEPSYSLFFKGSVLFKKNRELYYYFRSLNFSNSNPFVEHLDKSKYYIGYKSSYYDFKFGSIEKRLQQNLYGVGVDATFKLKQNKLNLIYSQDIYGNTESYAGDLAFSIQNIGLNMGAVHSEDITHSINNDVVYFGSNFNLFKKSNISFTVGANRVNDSIVGLTEGYGFSFNYKLNLKKFYFAIQTVLGSPYYVGVYRGQYNIKADAEYKISKISKIYAQYNRLVYNYSNSEIFVFHRNIEKYQLYFSKLFNNVNFQIGNYTYLYATDQLDPTDADLFYKSYSSHMFTSLNIIANRKISFNPRLELGQVRVLEPSSVDPSKNKPYSTFKISVNVTAKNYGLYTFFQNGPFNLFEQMYYFQNNFFTKWFYLMPYYKTTFLNKTVHLDVRANYINNIVTNENIFSLNTQLQWFLPRDFSIRLFNSISSRNRYDVGTNTKYNYSNTYFEVGIRKEFNCNQPRIQYYNLKVVFFRDLNGSRKKESNEPGISNIMVEIKKDFKKDDLDSYNEFVDAQLLTDYSGTVEYENIPNGFYNINYQLLAKITGNYSLEQLEAEVLMDEDKIIYIPYMENNKIIGKVVLNRNPLSSLGEMDISNIRVIAEDTQGHSYSALTDKQGN
ncbi:MAG: hypothetical protein JXR51_12480, partial [Bacteroidales bacterium]|nr:hypothetical protein [Bacteroidales bacterium]